MKTTFGKIIGAKGALGELMQEKLAVKEAVALARLCKALDSELQLFNERRAAIGAQYESAAQQEQAVRELLDVDVEIALDKVTLTLETASAAWVFAAEDFVNFGEE